MTKERRDELIRAMDGQPDEQAVLFIVGWSPNELTCGEMRALLSQERTCSTCRHWTHDDPEDEGEAICRRLVSRDCGVTALAIYKPGRRGQIETMALVTWSTFGCSLWEPKEGA